MTTAPVRPTASGWKPVAVVTATAALFALLLALVAGGGAPEAAPAGIPDPGLVTGWGLPVLNLAEDLLAVAVLGHLLVAAALPQRGKHLSGPARRMMPVIAALATGWWVAVLLRSLLEVSDQVAEPLPGALRGGTLTSYVTDLPAGRATLAVLCLTLPIALFASTVSSSRGARALLLVGLAALIPPATSGHAAGGDRPSLSVLSLAVHIVAVTVWVGGLAVLVVQWKALGPVAPSIVPRLSRLALACFVLVAASGTANALLHVPFTRLIDSSYGALIGAKIVALLLLGTIGFAHRRRAIPNLHSADRQVFLRLAVVEVVVMAVTIGLAVALSRTPPPL